MVVDAKSVGRASREDWDALNVREGFEDLGKRLGWLALGILEAIANDPSLGHVSYDNRVDKVHVWVVRLGGDQIFQRMKVGFPRSNRMKGLTTPEWTLRKRLQRDGGDYSVIVGAATESLP